MESANSENTSDINLPNEDEIIVTPSTANSINNTGSTNICRVCMSEEDVETSIFDKIDSFNMIMSILMLCASPLKISKNDNFPKQICKYCLDNLRVAYRLRTECLKTDQILRGRCLQSKIIDDSVEVVIKKRRIENNTQKSDLLDTSVTKSNEQQETTFLVLSQQLEELDGKTVDENIEVESNETSLENLLDTLEDNSPKQWPKQTTILNGSNSSKAVFIKGNTHMTPNQVIILPEHIQVKVAKKFGSDTGMFPCTQKQSICNTFFVMVDGYAFKLGLTKQKIRHLKCIMINCPAYAEQIMSASGTFEAMANVKTPHNHIKHNEQDMKKQIFINVMRKRIQNDKTLNIRQLYEEACVSEPEIKRLVPLRNVINEICRNQLIQKQHSFKSFEEFYNTVENNKFEKIHFTHSGQQFYQERFAAEDGTMALIFANVDVLSQLSDSKLMYVDTSFKINTSESFEYQLVTVLIWINNSYYPVMFALINRKSQEIFKLIFSYLRGVLAPNLRPQEIVTDYEANIYYALGETYVDSHIGGSVFYYIQNLYKKICSLQLAKELETNTYFRNIYHMLLMLPLLPVNTIQDGLNNIEMQAKEMGLSDIAQPIFEYIRTQWLLHVTPDLFCVHRLENRINENVIAPFKKFRDYLLLSKGKVQKLKVSIVNIVEKLIELENFLFGVYSSTDKKSFGRDLSSLQKKNVLRAWQFIENHPKININNFFSKVLGYIKCMENQLWIWGFYKYTGDVDEILIHASDFSIVNSKEDNKESEEKDDNNDNVLMNISNEYFCEEIADDTIIVEAVIDQDGGIVLQTNQTIEGGESEKQFENEFLKYVYQ